MTLSVYWQRIVLAMFTLSSLALCSTPSAHRTNTEADYRPHRGYCQELDKHRRAVRKPHQRPPLWTVEQLRAP
jgi:hypothetical protein